MKKLIIIFISLLLISGCNKSKQLTTEEYLLQIIENHKNASSMTIDINSRVNLGQNNTSLPIPIKATLLLDNKGNNDINDDEAYGKVSLSLVLMSLDIEGWYNDGIFYYKYGDDKRIVEVPKPEYRQIDENKVLQIIQDNCEDIVLDTNVNSTTITLTPKSDLLKSLLKELNIPNLPTIENIDLNEMLDNINFNDVVLTIDKNGYISKIKASGDVKFSTYYINGQIQLQFKDINKTTIPARNF